MFNVIEPQEHHLYESSINLFLRDLEISVGLKKDQNLNQATFILVEEEINGINGGILLLQQSLADLPPAIRTYLERLYPLSHKIWTGRIAFQMSEEISGRDFEKISKLLYCALYEDLIVFGVKESIPFLYLTMPLVEHLSINILGLWPYRLEVRSKVSSDGLFHGILSLAGATQPPSFLWNQEGSPFVPQICDKIVTL